MISLHFNLSGIFDATFINASLANGIALIASLIAVSLTESRMGRSRGRISFVRIFAPIGTIGFIGILKVHIATFVSFQSAKELNLPTQNYSSASRIGSMCKMHSTGIEWDKPVNCLAIGMDDTIPLKVSDNFTFTRDEQVKYISTEKRVELVNTTCVKGDKRNRMKSIAINLFLQSLLCFGITIFSEMAANRARSTFSLFFCASVTLTELITAIIEWTWTAVSTEPCRVVKLRGTKDASPRIIEDASPHCRVVKLRGTKDASPHVIEDADEKTIESLRIYEQKLRITIHRSELRQFKINRLVQIRIKEFEVKKKGTFLINKARQSLLRAIKNQDGQSEAVYTNSKAAFIFLAYIFCNIIGIGLVLCEIFTYVAYVSTSFAPRSNNLSDIEQQRALKSFGKWFGVQLGGFVIKALAPLFDRLTDKLPIDRFRDYLSQRLFPSKTKKELSSLKISGGVLQNTKWIEQGRIRAGNKDGVLLQTIEQLHSSIPFSHTSIVYLNGKRTRDTEQLQKFTAVPQVLLVSGLNSVKFLDSLNIVDAPRNWRLDIDEILNPEIHENGRSGFVMVLQFIPSQDGNHNEVLFVHIAVLKLEDIKESYHYRIVTSTEISSGNKLYATDFLVWDGNDRECITVYKETVETSVLTFSAAHVNESNTKEALLETKILEASSVPLPKDWRPPNFSSNGISTTLDPPPRTTPSTDAPANSEPTHRACLFEKLETLEKHQRHLGFRYIGRFYLQNCFVHRYHTVITAQGRLTEAHAQLQAL